MTTTEFPDAPDFNPQSQPWKRDAEGRILALEQQIAIANKNLRAFQRSAVAGTKATNLKISALQGVRIPPGMPIGISAFPYAYFTASGYPAAGVRITWGDQNDVDHYEIWVGKAPIYGEVVLGDAPVAFVSQTATADVRGLECNTDYELSIRAISFGGSYGFFSSTLAFTTPNVLTQIGPFSSPTVSYRNGFGIIEWPSGGVDAPAYIEYTESHALGAVSGTLTGWGNHGGGVLAPNGKVYYPPGGHIGSFFTPESRGLAVNPSTLTAVETDYGLPPYLGQEDDGDPDPALRGIVQGGVLGANGLIYWASNWDSVPGDGSGSVNWGTVIALDPQTETATFEPVEDGAVWSSMARGGNDTIYGRPANFDVTPEFLLIDSTGTVTTDDLGYTHSTGEYYGQGVTDSNGDVWFMPREGTDYFLKIDTGLGTVSKVAVDYPGGWIASGYDFLVGPALAPNGNIYAFGWDDSVPQKIWFEIQPDGTQTYGESSGLTCMGNTAIGTDGLIRGMGVPRDLNYFGGTPGDIDGHLVNSFGKFNPDTKAWAHTSLGSGVWEADSAVADADGMVLFRLTHPDYIGDVESNKFVTVESSAIEHGATVSTAIPNYLKHMLVERTLLDSDVWDQIGAMPDFGFFTDPTVLPNLDYEYRLTPLSTALVEGIPSLAVGLST